MKPQSLLQLCGLALLIAVLPACNSGVSIFPTAISPTATSLSPGVNRITFYVTGSENDVYVVNADGSHLTRLAENAAHPSWSPDGRYIAFLSDAVYLINAEGNNWIHLADLDVDSNLAWSPNGYQIVLSSFKNDGAGKIYLINNIEESLQGKGKLGGSHIRLNRQGVNAQNIVWSPDGRQIAFYYRRDLDSPHEIAVLNVEEALQSADGADWTYLTEGEMPAWSPDGKKIAFSGYQNGNYDIYVMEADGNNETRLTQTPADDWPPAWSPDGQRIAFFSKQGSQAGLYVMNADGSNSTRLIESLNYASYLTWSPDGQQIAFLSGPDSLNGSLYVMNADGSHLLRLTDSSLPLWPQVPAWSPR